MLTYCEQEFIILAAIFGGLFLLEQTDSIPVMKKYGV